MALNFNVDPYYDDFDPTKNFHRILFKPGYAVQARELTQSQTILQDQISKFGLGIFADGSKVSGGNISVDTNVTTVKLAVIGTDLNTYLNYYAVGQTSNFIAEVIKVDIVNNYLITKPINTQNNRSFSSGETINLYLSKTNALSSLSSTVPPQYVETALTTSTISRLSSGNYLSRILTVPTGNINIGDTINIPSINFTATVISKTDVNNLVINIPLTKDISNQPTTITNQISVNCLEVGIDAGVWFTNGLFISNYSSSIVPDPLNSYPSVVVGFEINETVVDSTNDPSLLDPAIGASNYQAPGADRYNVTLNLVSKPYISDQTVANLTTVKFIELVRINAGVVEDVNTVPVFTSVSQAIAQAISDTSGDFIVNPFSLLIASSYTTSNVFNSSISAGKVYLGGSPVQHIAPTPYLLEKARDTNTLSNQDIITYYGNYTKIKNLNGSIINFQQSTRVELHNAVFGTANSTTKIGTARVRNFDYDSGSNSSTAFKSFLSDVNLVNNSFSNVKSMILPGGGTDYVNVTFSANTVSSSNLIDSNYSSLIFPLPQKNISNVSSVNYSTHRYFNAASFTNGSYTITTNGTNELFEPGTGSVGSAQRQLYFSVVTTSASGSYTTGQFIPMDQANVSIVIDNSAALPQATVNIGGGFNGSATIYATVGISNDTIMNKSLTTNQVVQVSANTLNTSLDLGKSDIYTFHGVYELGNTHIYVGTWSDITTYANNSAVYYLPTSSLSTTGNIYISLTNSNTGNTPGNSITWSVVTNNVANYSTDNGQRDTYYDHGYVTNKSGISKGNIAVVFDYFTHSGGTGLFTVDSYPVNYDKIPNYTSQSTGTTYNLRDVLDFRPRRTDGASTIDIFQLPSPFSNEFININYGYYLSRTDKIVLYPNGQFKTIRGTSSYANPITPSDIPGTLTLFTINYPAYTFSKGDVIVTPNTTRKYSMRDIGVLDKRISNLEYYTTLSLLENQVTGSDVTDSTGLNLLFKNGFLVDSFKGQSIGDVLNPDYAISIDPTNQLARPIFRSNVANYYVDTNQGVFLSTPPSEGNINNYLTLNNNIITFAYNETPLVFQNVATQLININPFNVFNFIGGASLTPSSDVWYSTITKPNINIMTEDQAAWQAAVNGTGNGSQWNDWQLNWSGQNVVSTSDQSQISRDTQSITNVITSQGLTSALQGGNIQVSSTTQILSNAIIPYARTIPVQFQIHGMAPFTQLHTFINGTNIDNYVTPNILDRVYSVTITNGGSGYVDGNNLPIISISGANTTQATATANVFGGQIVSVNVISTGSGYISTPIINAIASNTGAAILTTTASTLGAALVSDISGYVSGTFNIPNDSVLQFPTGTLMIECSDNLVNPAISQTYAKSTFVSGGTLQTQQTTVVSTRPPQATPRPQVVAVPYTPPPTPPIEYAPVVTPTPATPTTSSGTTTTTQGPTVFTGAYAADPNSSVSTFAESYAGYAGNIVGNGSVQAQILSNYFFGSPVLTSSGHNSTSDLTFQSITAALFPQDLSTTSSDSTPLFNIIYDYTKSNNGGQPPTPGQVGVVLTQAVQNVYASPTILNDINTIAGSLYDDTHIEQTTALVQNALNGTYVPTASAATNTVAFIDPLSQNFIVNAGIYPNGVFLSSVDLYFATVDPTIPVNVRIKPTVNGYPDAVNDIPGSIIWKNPANINIPEVNQITNGLGTPTTFTFDHPIYLIPGEYSIMISANSNKYQMYASKVGQVQYGTQTTVSQLNYAASLFKSQNSSTWVPAPSETLCFNLKLCTFGGGSVTFDITSNTSSSAIQYDLVQLLNNDLSFNSLDSINYKILTKDSSSGVQIGPNKIISHQNFNFSTRQQQLNSGDIIIRSTVTNADRYTSPVIDLERLNTVLVKNIITPYNSANTVSESLSGHYNGGASARYITRRVTLNNNFDSTGLTVYMDVNRQSGTKIEVYYKVLNANDPNNFDDQPYVLMNPILSPGSGLVITDAISYTQDMYQALNISYNDIVTNTLYTNFKVFAIKVVMYSNNPAIAPQIKNFRAIATA